MHAIGNGAIVEQRSKHMLHRHHHGINALYVKKGFLLAGEGGVRHVFRGSGRTHGERRIRLTVRQLLVGVADCLLQLRLERCIDDPLTDLRAGLGQLADIVGIGTVQQFIDTLVDAALVEKVIKRLGGCRKTIRNRHPKFRQIGDHFPQRGIFASHPLNVVHTKLVIPQDITHIRAVVRHRK